MMIRSLLTIFSFCLLAYQAHAQERLTVEHRKGLVVDLPDSVTDEHAWLRWLKGYVSHPEYYLLRKIRA